MNVQLTLALRYLNGRKLRSFLTTLAVVFGVLVIFGMNIIIPTVLQSFQAIVLAASENVDLTASLRTGEPFPVSVLETVRGVEGIRVAQGALSRTVNLPADFFDADPETADGVTVVSLVGVDPDAAQQVRNYGVESGRFLQPGDTAVCVVAQSLADNLNLKVGDRLPLPTIQGRVELTVVGIRAPRSTPGNEEVLVTLPEAQRLLDAQGRVNVIEANYASGDETRRSEIQMAVEARLGDTYQFGALGFGSDVFATVKLAESLFNVFGFLTLFMGGFIIFNTFRTLVAERRRDFGMLRAVGASRRTIVGLVLAEGLVQGGAGTALGILLGYAFGSLALAGVGPVLESYVHLRLGQPVVSPGLVVITIILGVGISLVAGLLPALSAGRLTPLEALRPSVAHASYRKGVSWGTIAGIVVIALAFAALFSGSTVLVTVGAPLFLFGLVLVAPALVRPIALAFGTLFAIAMARQGIGQLAQSNLNRQPTRAAVTASTTMIAMAILVCVGGMTATLQGGIVDTLKRSLSSDYLFIPPAVSVWGSDVGADRGFVQQLKAVHGVGPVSSFRSAMTQDSQGLTISLLGIDPAAFPQVSGLRFEQGSAGEAYSALGSERTIIVNGVFASAAGLKIGDVVSLVTPNGRQDYRVVGVGNDYLNIKVITGYVAQSNLAADFGKTEDVFIQLNLLPGADRDRVEGQLKAIKQQYPQFTMVSGQGYVQQSMDLISTALVGIYVLFVFLAIPSLIAMLNTLTIGVIERTREIGTLRAVGAEQKQVHRMVLIEAVLLAAVGTAFGLLAGLYLGYALIYAFRTSGFPMDYVFPWSGLLIATAVGLLFGGLAAIIPARQAARLVIVQALRYE